MNKILKKTYFSEKVVQMVVEAPLIAKSRKPGNFVIVRVGEKGERMPLTISDADPVKGTITLVIQKMGVSSTKLCNLEEGCLLYTSILILTNPELIRSIDDQRDDLDKQITAFREKAIEMEQKSLNLKQQVLPVSYTHLDVYKRQAYCICFTGKRERFSF